MCFILMGGKPHAKTREKDFEAQSVNKQFVAFVMWSQTWNEQNDIEKTGVCHYNKHVVQSEHVLSKLTQQPRVGVFQ